MNSPYTPQYYAELAGRAQRSANEILPWLRRFVHFDSVLDVGCGVGAWLSILPWMGISDYHGIDGDWVDKSQLLIPQEQFSTVDLRLWQPVSRIYDLAVCVEVAEHLPESAADTLVNTLVKSAPMILFSAAIPGQGGTDHINLQWPEYWADIFAEHGYVPLDIRPAHWNNPLIEWWYRQNLLLFVGPNTPKPLRHPEAT